MERIEKIDNVELKDLLTELKSVDQEIVALVEESEKAQETFNTQTMIRQKIVDKMKPIVNELYDGKLGEFDVISNLTLSDSGEVEVKIVDEMEVWINAKREQKKEKFISAEQNKELIEEKVA